MGCGASHDKDKAGAAPADAPPDAPKADGPPAEPAPAKPDAPPAEPASTKPGGAPAAEAGGDPAAAKVKAVQSTVQKGGRGCRKDKTKKVKHNPNACRTEPRKVDWSSADPSRWEYKSVTYNGGYMMSKQPELEETSGTVESGIQKLKDEATKYLGLYYQTNMTEWPEDQQKYTLVKRTKSGFAVKEEADGPFTYVKAKYQALDPLESIDGDGVTDKMTYEGYALPKPILPGRGQGVADVPMIKILGDADPSDVSQGSVGDCWLLSAISAVGEFDGGIKRLFRNTPGLDDLPASTPNSYTITLCDVATWEPRDIVIDEQLCQKADGTGLLGAQPSHTGELWVCYLEKAIAIHCGGWDNINGGQCTHAWAMLTGCKHQYTFMDNGGFSCFGKFNPNTKDWEPHANNPREGFQSLWPMDWPEVGGGGDMNMKVDRDQMFERLCEWDDAGYMMGCGTKAGSDTQETDGIVDGHAYTILEVISNAGGTDHDLIKVRNPWGRGEFKSGNWDDDGPGWGAHPEVKAACNPVVANDGVFWVDKAEFFEYFHTIYMCALDMGEFCASGA